MDFDEQLRLIRIRKNIEFEKYKNRQIENNMHDEPQKEFNIKEYEPKKKVVLDPIPVTNNPTCITTKEEELCINASEINQILPANRFIVEITNQHNNEYSEKDIPENILEMHRYIYKITMPRDTFPLFKYCFDIRNLYPKKNSIIEIDNNFYFLQPDDHTRINDKWKELYGPEKDVNYSEDFDWIDQTSQQNYDSAMDYFSDSYLDAFDIKYVMHDIDVYDDHNF